MAAPVLASNGTIADTATTTCAVPVPSGVASGSLIVAYIYAAWFNGTTPTAAQFTPPAGSGTWVIKDIVTHALNGPNQHAMIVAYKYATGSDSGTYSWTINNVGGTAPAFASGVAERVTGGATSGDPFADAVQKGSSADGTSSVTVASFTPGGDNTLLTAYAMDADSPATVSLPGGWTSLASSNGAGASGSSVLGDLTQGTAAATGTLTFSSTSSTFSKLALVATFRAPPAQALPPSAPSRRAQMPRRPRRPAAAPLRVTLTVPPQRGTARRGWLPPRKPRTGQIVPAQVVVVTTQALSPQSARQRPVWLPRRRPRAGQPVPPQVVVQTVQALPPQPGRRPPRLPIAGRHRTGQVVPAQVVVATVQVLPPQPGRRPLRLAPPVRHRVAQSVPAAVVVVTAQALPPQPTRRPTRPLLGRRPRTTPPPLTVAVAIPPQPTRRRAWAPVRRRPRAAQPVPAQVIIVTAQALPPQPMRRLRWLPQRRRNQLGQPVPPQTVTVISIPVTVTGADRPTTTVTGSDRPSASVTGSDQATVTITSQ